MYKYWRRHRFLLILVYSIFVALCIGLFVVGAIFQKAEANSLVSIYEKTEIDFIAPSPSYEQVNELNEKSYIAKATPYYVSSMQLAVNDEKEVRQEVILLDNISDKKYTSFTDERLITEFREGKNIAYTDYIFAKNMGVKVGSTLTIVAANKSFEYTVGGIYEADTLTDKGMVLIEYSGNLKNAVEELRGKSLPYSGVYVKASDNALCKNYFQTEYKPLGLLKDRSEFLSDEAYKIHYDGFWNTDFSNQITNMGIGYENVRATTSELNTRAVALFAIAVVLLAFSSIIPSIIFGKNKKEKRALKVFMRLGASKKAIKQYFYCSFAVEAILFVAVICLSIAIGFLVLPYYFRLQSIAPWLIGLSASWLCGIVITILYNFYAVKMCIKFKKFRTGNKKPYAKK